MPNQLRRFAIILMAGTITGCAGDTGSRIIKPADVDRELKSEWNRVIATAAPDPKTRHPHDWQMQLTTWLPNEWPPTPNTIWTRYAYGLDVTLDGSAGVGEPFARIERPPGEVSRYTLTPLARKLKSVETHAVRPTSGWHYSLEDEKRVLAIALALKTVPRPGAPGTRDLPAYYQSWRLANPEIARQLHKQHRAFFAWLDHQ